MSGIPETGRADESMCTSSDTQFHFKFCLPVCPKLLVCALCYVQMAFCEAGAETGSRIWSGLKCAQLT